ncbi:uncharacterized protein MKK02DRAFT_28482 [Dioszegia hungarica]|uniref:Uncharacterized protein n=1 Tax=Dioszegia hungarica TaxID=4972 RepID=A0AA38H432_9TREE|nr:uncharacterized protein MKK02DRAFT_28482 [Dioszegia hungarica]KAI9633696.1 hypothetical protein MKK02DRAFT_28482 [Dioszegia hungarica]
MPPRPWSPQRARSPDRYSRDYRRSPSPPRGPRQGLRDVRPTWDQYGDTRAGSASRQSRDVVPRGYDRAPAAGPARQEARPYSDRRGPSPPPRAGGGGRKRAFDAVESRGPYDREPGELEHGLPRRSSREVSVDQLRHRSRPSLNGTLNSSRASSPERQRRASPNAQETVPALEDLEKFLQLLITAISATSQKAVTSNHLDRLLTFPGTVHDSTVIADVRRELRDAQDDARRKTRDLNEAWAGLFGRYPKRLPSAAEVEGVLLQALMDRVKALEGGGIAGEGKGKGRAIEPSLPTPTSAFPRASPQPHNVDDSESRKRQKQNPSDLAEYMNRVDALEALVQGFDTRFNELENWSYQTEAAEAEARAQAKPVGSWEELENERDPLGRLRGQQRAAAGAPVAAFDEDSEVGQALKEIETALEDASKESTTQGKQLEEQSRLIEVLRGKVRKLSTEVQTAKAEREERDKAAEKAAEKEREDLEERLKGLENTIKDECQTQTVKVGQAKAIGKVLKTLRKDKSSTGSTASTSSGRTASPTPGPSAMTGTNAEQSLAADAPVSAPTGSAGAGQSAPAQPSRQVPSTDASTLRTNTGSTVPAPASTGLASKPRTSNVNPQVATNAASSAKQETPLSQTPVKSATSGPGQARPPTPSGPPPPPPPGSSPLAPSQQAVRPTATAGFGGAGLAAESASRAAQPSSGSTARPAAASSASSIAQTVQSFPATTQRPAAAAPNSAAGSGTSASTPLVRHSDSAGQLASQKALTANKPVPPAAAPEPPAPRPTGTVFNPYIAGAQPGLAGQAAIPPSSASAVAQQGGGPRGVPAPAFKLANLPARPPPQAGMSTSNASNTTPTAPPPTKLLPSNSTDNRQRPPHLPESRPSHTSKPLPVPTAPHSRSPSPHVSQNQPPLPPSSNMPRATSSEAMKAPMPVRPQQQLPGSAGSTSRPSNPSLPTQPHSATSTLPPGGPATANTQPAQKQPASSVRQGHIGSSTNAPAAGPTGSAQNASRAPAQVVGATGRGHAAEGNTATAVRYPWPAASARPAPAATPASTVSAAPSAPTSPLNQSSTPAPRSTQAAPAGPAPPTLTSTTIPNVPIPHMDVHTGANLIALSRRYRNDIDDGKTEAEAFNKLPSAAHKTLQVLTDAERATVFAYDPSEWTWSDPPGSAANAAQASAGKGPGSAPTGQGAEQRNLGGNAADPPSTLQARLGGSTGTPAAVSSAPITSARISPPVATSPASSLSARLGSNNKPPLAARIGGSGVGGASSDPRPPPSLSNHGLPARPAADMYGTYQYSDQYVPAFEDVEMGGTYRRSPAPRESGSGSGSGLGSNGLGGSASQQREDELKQRLHAKKGKTGGFGGQGHDGDVEMD